MDFVFKVNNDFKLDTNIDFSIDSPDGTGDHENYFVETKDAYELDGTHYTDCRKIAVNIRSKYGQKLWTAINDFTFLYSNGFKFFDIMKPMFQEQTPVFSPDFS